ncbi:DUF726 domain-containing protein [Microbacterium aurugineum]|uniref:DUF726 domain-containing protein n=1 Tax=Microbacterium aurugineum TaxID=2851642 RepID=UPI003558A7AB
MPSFQASLPGQARSDVTYPCSSPPRGGPDSCCDVATCILKFVHKTAQAGETAAGLVGFTPMSGKMQNIDVSDHVKTHFDYQDNVQLA